MTPKNKWSRNSHWNRLRIALRTILAACYASADDQAYTLQGYADVYPTGPHQRSSDRQIREQRLDRKYLLRSNAPWSEERNKVAAAAKLSIGDSVKVTLHVRNVCHGCRMERELLQEMESHSGCRISRSKASLVKKGDSF